MASRTCALLFVPEGAQNMHYTTEKSKSQACHQCRSRYRPSKEEPILSPILFYFATPHTALHHPREPESRTHR